MSTVFQTPILFIIFNRPDTTIKVFEEIRKVKPAILYIAADGPRASKPGEAEKCSEARSITNKVDWPCEVKTLFREQNLGCQQAVSGAISWFFEHVEEGIILEDDCVPAIAFFDFCERLLAKYRHDMRVMQISGNTFLNQNFGDGDYYFSLLPHIWGWATWKRAWALADIPMATWPEFKKGDYLKEQFPGARYREKWEEYFEDTYSGKIDSWGMPWAYSVISNNGLCINPNKNLVSNIGFGANATHTLSENHLANLPIHEMKLQKHPTFVYPAPDLTAPLMEHLYFIWDPPFHRRLINNIKLKLVNLGIISKDFKLRKQ